MNKTMAMVFALITLVLGFAGGYWLSLPKMMEEDTDKEAASDEREVLFWRNPMNPAITSPVFMKDEMGMDYLPVYADKESADKEKPKKEREVLFWRNPMNPAITSPVFMKDEMGMDYLPVYADKEGADEPAGTVKIDPVTVQNIGVRTAKVEQRQLARQLNALGRVVFNEEHLASLHPKTSGWIEKLNVDETGVEVKRDTILLNIYSPDLVAAEREYLVALSNWETVRNSNSSAMKKNAKSVLTSARERLELFDVPEHQIRELEAERKIKKYLHIHSPFTGRIMNIGAREGQYVTPKDELYLIADLSRIWVYVDVFEDELPWIKEGDAAVMTVRAAPGQTFQGKVTFIYPTLHERTRTVRVRLEFENPGLILKPGMFANVVLHADPQPDAIVVPTEAIVRSGSREQVFVVRDAGKFEPREVRLGFSANGYTQILEGIKAGEEVVTSSQFLIDSESKLREATAKMMKAMSGGDDMGDIQGSMSVSGGRTPEETGMDMGDMSMDDMSMDDMEMGDIQGSMSVSGGRTPEEADMNMEDMDMSNADGEGMKHD